MRARPDGLADTALRDALTSEWGLEVTALDYAAVGFGSHHWVAETGDGERWFVTVDDLTKVRLDMSRDEAFDALGRAFETVVLLERDGFDALVAPVPARSGTVLARLGEDFSVALFPWVDAPEASWTAHRPEDVPVLEAILCDLHGRTAAVAGTAATDDLSLPCRGSLEEALRELAAPWVGGPFAEPVRVALDGAAAHVRDALSLYDDLVERVRSNGGPLVVTHGEPHAGNVLWTADGPKLIDWDTVRIAPPERDLWMLMAHDEARRDPRPGVMLFALWWDLAEIGEYVTELRAPHADTANTREAFANFGDYIDLERHWAHVLTT